MIRELKPKIFVELGSHAGHSYFAFCQAVKDAALQAKCFAVDTWAGDGITTGHYGDDVYMAVDAHNKESYAAFSSLLQMTFDEALNCFENASIELLHIDGLHTYDAVRHDFETWLPKLAPGAVVLFHDTVVRAENFGVWKFWEELKGQYTRNLEFEHSSGLGVLQIDNPAGDKKPKWLEPQFPQKTLIIDYFSALGSREFERYDLVKTHEEVDQLKKMVAKSDSQVAKQIQDFSSEFCYRDIKANNKIFMFYEDFLSLMDDDIRIAKKYLDQEGMSFEQYCKILDGLVESEWKCVYSFAFDSIGKTVIREQEEIKWVERRVQIYHQWLVSLTRLISFPNFRVAIDLRDMVNDLDIPILSFHKKSGQNIILVPDFEIYEQNYYRRDIYSDSVAFQGKLDKAIFVGSTTGTVASEVRSCCNTIENINNDPSVRLSAAKFFESSESVVFKLPSVVQCDSQETEAYLKTFTFTQCDRIDWSGQFKYKFIISVDGNGPTCTRVAATLLSHSVLLKYQSQWITYYHRALRPFVNYVPISWHSDVNHALSELKDNYAFYSNISRAANEDFSLLFKKSNVDRFFAAVLNEFYALFRGRDNIYWNNRQRIDQVTHFDIEAHFANVGDVWLYPSITIKEEAENYIQGLTISPASGLFEWNDISYQVMFEDGSASDIVCGGKFCGTRGQSKNIIGFRMSAQSRFRFSFFYSGVFSNDAVKKVRMGEWLTHDNMFIKCIELHLEPLVM